MLISAYHSPNPFPLALQYHYLSNSLPLGGLPIPSLDIMYSFKLILDLCQYIRRLRTVKSWIGICRPGFSYLMDIEANREHIFAVQEVRYVIADSTCWLPERRSDTHHLAWLRRQEYGSKILCQKAAFILMTISRADHGLFFGVEWVTGKFGKVLCR